MVSRNMPDAATGPRADQNSQARGAVQGHHPIAHLVHARTLRNRPLQRVAHFYAILR